MLSPLRNRFGAPGVIAVIALVFAMLGGAYAATSDNGGKATASAKGPRGPRGPKGPKGDPGPAGPQGPAGPAGAKGDTGAKGDKGDTGNTGGTGSAGANGKNAEAIPFSGSKTIGSVTCTEGGLEVKSASATTLVCNGVKGANGTNGTNGTTGFTETLPPSKTETGSWGGVIPAVEYISMPISFPIPLAAAIPGPNVKTMKIGEAAKTGCENAAHPGAASSANPEAEPGFLCIYVGFGNASVAPISLRSENGSNAGASTAGAMLVEENAPGLGVGGTFAVTAP